MKLQQAVLASKLLWPVEVRATADELLEARLARGRTPTPTGTVEGDVVLGHAACVVTHEG